MENIRKREESSRGSGSSQNGTSRSLRWLRSMSRSARCTNALSDDNEKDGSGYSPLHGVSGLRGDYPTSSRRRTVFERLRPATGGPRDEDSSPAPGGLIPPPDFEHESYSRGWVSGKKHKLVNVDAVHNMRKIAMDEMKRKDQQIQCLNEQLGEDAKTMEHLQLEVQSERQKRMAVERDNVVLRDQVDMLIDMYLSSSM
ncbi:hypothetical protein R1flu_013000 [Riccia fluitans]|uniref:Uncharacterized protein n=1 Tax=Riccia fluitans TaxID=41844 RepID=A0ABD1ZCH7_9MARC